MKHGEIQETGTHQELLERKGLYYNLVNNQVFVDTHETGKFPKPKLEPELLRLDQSPNFL